MTQQLIPTLYHLDHSAAFRCLWALEELRETRGVQYHLINNRRQRGSAPPELKEIFPLGKSPILKLESTTEGRAPPTIQLLPGVLTEAQLILRFLSREYGAGLWDPENEADRNRDEFFQGFAMMTLVPKLDLPMIFESIISMSPFGISTVFSLTLSPIISICKQQLKPIIQVMEDALNDEQPWFSGAKFGLADFNVCWGIDLAAQREYFDPSAFPKLSDWHGRVKARSGYKSALEKGNGYNLKTFGI